MAQPRDLAELRALVRRLEAGVEGLSTEALQAARFPEARVSAMRDALRLTDELTGLTRALESHVPVGGTDERHRSQCMQGSPEAQRDALHGLLTGVTTRLTALQESRMDTVAHLALHEVPFDTRLYRQAARAVSGAVARYVDAVLQTVCCSVCGASMCTTVSGGRCTLGTARWHLGRRPADSAPVLCVCRGVGGGAAGARAASAVPGVAAGRRAARLHGACGGVGRNVP